MPTQALATVSGRRRSCHTPGGPVYERNHSSAGAHMLAPSLVAACPITAGVGYTF